MEKNKLQEIFMDKNLRGRLNALKFPVYKTIKAPASLEEEWVCSVDIGEEIFEGSGSKKRDAERDAARQAIQYIECFLDIEVDKAGKTTKTLRSPSVPKTPSLSPTKSKTYVLIDQENKPTFLRTLMGRYRELGKEVEIHVFFSRRGNVKYKPDKEGIIYHMCPVMAKDASDIELILFVASLKLAKRDRIFVISGDHFADTLCRILSLKGINCKAVDHIDCLDL